MAKPIWVEHSKLDESREISDALSEPRVVYSSASEYLEKNKFDLYIINKFTEHLPPKDAQMLLITKSDITLLNDFIKTFEQKHSRVVAIGAGAVIDAAKYICLASKSEFYCIPSALSTNSFATHRNSFFDDKFGKDSFNSVTAREIVADFDLIEQAPILNRFGLVEIAAASIAHVDCIIATERNNEHYDMEILEQARKLSEQTLTLIPGLLSRSKLVSLFHCLMESGRITRVYGSGRLVCGAEHVISAYLEGELACPHGMGLLFGILISYRLQSNEGYSDATANTIVTLLEEDRIMRNYVFMTGTAEQIMNILRRVQSREDKFTILSLVSNEKFLRVANKVIEEYFERENTMDNQHPIHI